MPQETQRTQPPPIRQKSQAWNTSFLRGEPREQPAYTGITSPLSIRHLYTSAVRSDCRCSRRATVVRSPLSERRNPAQLEGQIHFRRISSSRFFRYSSYSLFRRRVLRRAVDLARFVLSLVELHPGPLVVDVDHVGVVDDLLHQCRGYCQSGASIGRAPALSTSTRFPPRSMKWYHTPLILGPIRFNATSTQSHAR